MRVGIISDIHGNAVALEAVLQDGRDRSLDQWVCLGDAIQGGPQPVEVARKLMALGCPVVMGNADAWLLSGEETGGENIPPERRRKMGHVREWTLARLSDDERSTIAGFAPTVQVLLDGRRGLLAFHGSPTSFDDILLPHMPEEEYQRLLGPYAASHLCGGHVHLQQLRRIGDSIFFNPGSVGLAYSHHQPARTFRADPWAEYAVLEANGPRVSLEFRRLPFDVAELVRVYQDSGRPYADEAIAQYAAAQ